MERVDQRQTAKKHGRGRIIAGLIIVATGSLLLARKMGVAIPGWLFSWEMLLIALGVFIGAKDGFRKVGWLLPIAIGVLLLLDDWVDGFHIQRYIWPLLIIAAGLFIMLRPKGACTTDHDGQPVTSSDGLLDLTSVFSGIKRNIVSSDFRGGEINCIFGGAELDLSQSDIHGRVILEANQIFGGTKLIIPPHWQLHSEMTAVIGGIEDKRPVPRDGSDPDKILVLRGSCFCGGMEIKSY